MASWTIDITFPRRRAKARLYNNVAEKLELIDEVTLQTPAFSEYDCFVLFTSHEGEADESWQPVFVCEFNNGRVFNVPTESVRFVDTDEKGELLE